MLGYARSHWQEVIVNLRLLGPFPPPFGGVAIHLVRLLELLRAHGVAAEGFSLGGTMDGRVKRFSWITALDGAPTHYHTDEGNMKWMVVLGTMWRLRRTPYIVTVHSFRDRPELHDRKWLIPLRKAYMHARAVIAISDDVARDLRHRLNLPDLMIDVIGSDLPISQWERSQKPPTNIPEEWLDASMRILANAGRVVRYMGKDLYGLDVLIEAVRGLASDVHCLIVVGEIVDEPLFNELVDAVKAVPNCHLMRSTDTPLVPLVALSHIVVRPTRTEGGRSLTLSEALELGKVAIGSDAVERPKGTILFKNEDPSALRAALSSVLRSPTSGPELQTQRIEVGEVGEFVVQRSDSSVAVPDSNVVRILELLHRHELTR